MVHRLLSLLIAGLSVCLALVHFLNGHPSGGLFIVAIFTLIQVYIAYVEDFEK